MNLRTTTATVCLVALLMTTSAVSLAQQEPRKLDSQESAFLRQRAQDDVFMWRLAEYAATHAATDRVKQLGKEIAKERRDDLRDIQQFSENHQTNIEQPKDLDLKQKTLYDRLTSKSGIDFDREYTKLLVQDYSTAIPQYERERDRAATPEVRDYANRQLTRLQDHLNQAKDAEKDVWK